MNKRAATPRTPKGITRDQHVLAEHLLGMSGSEHGLKMVENTRTGYIVLEIRKGASIQHKNAVSILKNGVGFQVFDWSDEIEADKLGLITKRARFGQLKF